ncbi:DUF1385 domain-containing protein [Raoultibacter phocaeensis]|uniref:DUF1385 domain-containing protein n=1 Tax=Raoultibacter phocaeensis TaxID=2479841 RepID=UPI001118143E|nr:DUF1385 domain-containing protein [Raoultibacter phocaeensis]
MAENKSDLSRAFKEDGALKTHVGGQALIEGIMMRGKFNWSVAVREPSGSIYIEEHDLNSGKKKNGWMYWPLVRGCRALVESLILGYKALEIAALHAFAEESGEKEDGKPAKTQEAAASPATGAVDGGETGSAADPIASDDGASSEGSAGVAEERPFSWNDDFGRPDTVIDALGAQTELKVEHIEESGREHLKRAEEVAAAEAALLEGEFSEPEEKQKKSFMDEEVEFGKKEMALSMVLGLVLGVVLFIVAPAFITNLIVGEYDQNTLLWNVVDGLLRVAVFVFYIWLIGRMGEIKRMFGYHGAEHKTIHCYEHGLDLTPENARSFPRLHVRCGTAFLIMVMVIAIIVYTVTPINALIDAWGVPDGAPKLALVILVRILLMPVIAGISYEITVKWAGSHPDNPLVKVILWPGMQMQYLTTNEPDDGQIECAIAAMQLVLERERAEEAKAAGQPASEAARAASGA